MRVLILSRIPTVRAGLAALLVSEPGIETGSGLAQSDDVLPVDMLLADADTFPEAEEVEGWLQSYQPRKGLLLMAHGGAMRTRGHALAGLARAAAAHNVTYGVI